MAPDAYAKFKGLHTSGALLPPAWCVRVPSSFDSSLSLAERKNDVADSTLLWFGGFVFQARLRSRLSGVQPEDSTRAAVVGEVRSMEREGVGGASEPYELEKVDGGDGDWNAMDRWGKLLGRAGGRRQRERERGRERTDASKFKRSASPPQLFVDFLFDEDLRCL